MMRKTLCIQEKLLEAYQELKYLTRNILNIVGKID